MSVGGRIRGTMKFLAETERLKSVTRHSWMSSGRQESVAEHSWRMAVFAMVLADEFPAIDMNKVLRMILVHDLGEAYEGDQPSLAKPNWRKKHATELRAIRKVIRPLPPKMRRDIVGLWEEYDKEKIRDLTPEAKLVKAIDKLEALMQHNQARLCTWMPCEYEVNLTYGRAYMGFHQFIRGFRKVVDAETRSKIRGAKRPVCPLRPGRRGRASS